MNRTTYNLKAILQGDVYHRTLALGMSVTDTACLVLPYGHATTPPIEKVLKELAPSLVAVIDAFEWPGTQLVRSYNRPSKLFKYRYDFNVLRTLRSCSQSIYDWLWPDLPEDLCLLRVDGTPWLVSITHEHDAYFIFTDEDLASARAEIPELMNFIELAAKEVP